MRLKLRAALAGRRDRAKTVGKKAQRSLGGDVRIELAHRARGCVARVHKRFAALLALTLIERIKVGTAHVHLATHFQQRRHVAGQGQGDLPEGADVVRHILAHLAITARGGLYQATVFVAQAHGKAIKFGLSHVFDRGIGLGQSQLFAHARIKSLGARGLGVGLGVNAEHGHGMPHRRQALHHRADHALRGRIGRNQLGVLGLQRLQLAKHAVVFGIGHRGRILHVIRVRPAVQLRTQRVYFGSRFDSGLRFTGLFRSRKKVRTLCHFSGGSAKAL